MNVSRTHKIAIGAAALSLALVGAAGAANAASNHAPRAAGSVAAEQSTPKAGTSGPEIHFWTEGLAQPGAELDVYADCGLNKNGVVVTTAKLSGVATGVMSPGADTPYLVGTVTLPKDFSKAAALNLTCDNQATATTVIVPGENVSTADGLIPNPRFQGYESEGMGEDEPTLEWKGMGEDEPLEWKGMGEEPTPESAGMADDADEFWDGDGYLVPDDCEGDCPTAVRV